MARLTSIMVILLLGTEAFVCASQPVTISGRILGEGKPLSGIVVELHSTNAVLGNPLIVKTRTDAEGRFRFENVSPGRYQIVPIAFVWIATCDRSNPRSSCNVSVIDGEATPEVSIDLIRGGVLTGKILNHDGRPAVESGVGLTRKDGIYIQGTSFYQSGQAADDRGVYRIYGITPGRYLVAVSGNPTTYYPGVTDAAEAQEVEIGAGVEVEGVDIQLKPRKQREKHRFITGRVVARDTGTPVPKAVVRFVRRHEPGGGSSISQVVTDQNGAFQYQGSPGHYRINAIGDEQRYGSSEKVEIEVGESDVEGIELKAEIGASISGAVVYVGSPPQKLDDLFAGSPLTVSHRYDDGSGSPLKTIRLDRDGKFKLSGLPSGEYMISFHPRGESGWVVIGVEERYTGQGEWFRVGPGEEIRDFRLLLTRGTGVIRGRVQVIGEELPSNANVVVLVWRENHFGEYGTALEDIDSRGNFRIEGMMPGRYIVACDIVYRGPPVPSGKRNPQTVVARVDIAEGQVVTLDLRYDIRQ